MQKMTVVSGTAMQNLVHIGKSCSIIATGKNNFKIVVHISQKQMSLFVKFVHTYWERHGNIITVKTPQYII